MVNQKLLLGVIVGLVIFSAYQTIQVQTLQIDVLDWKQKHDWAVEFSKHNIEDQKEIVEAVVTKSDKSI